MLTLLNQPGLTITVQLIAVNEHCGQLRAYKLDRIPPNIYTDILQVLKESSKAHPRNLEECCIFGGL